MAPCLRGLGRLTGFRWYQLVPSNSQVSLSGPPGQPPATLLHYFPDDWLLVVDESHVAMPQAGGMYRGDRARKQTLVDFGFRLPSALDNRPLKFEEWDAMRPQTVCVSATPGKWEMNQTGGVFAEQVIRPTGLIDPPVFIRPVKTQVDDLVAECKEVALKGYRILVTTLTKRMAEELTDYLGEHGVKHGVQQAFLLWEVSVQRSGVNAEFFAQSADRQIRDIVGFHKLQRDPNKIAFVQIGPLICHHHDNSDSRRVKIRSDISNRSIKKI